MFNTHHGRRDHCDTSQDQYFNVLADMLLLCSVEKERVQNMLNTLDPQYKVYIFLKIAITPLYMSTCEKVKAGLHNVEFLWSSSTGKPYMTYTVHFVDNEWYFQRQCLQVLYVPQDHIADNLADTMVDTLDTWGLDAAKQVCLTTDNERNIVCATSHRLRWNHLPCFAHNLHLAVENSMKDERRVY